MSTSATEISIPRYLYGVRENLKPKESLASPTTSDRPLLHGKALLTVEKWQHSQRRGVNF